MILLLVALLPLTDAAVLFKRSLYDMDIVFEGVDGEISGPANPGERYMLSNGLAARSGSATRTHTCNSIRGVPSNLRSSAEMYPHGLTSFYQKYTEAYGIPVVSSGRVPDDALRRACYITRFLMADHSGVRNNYYRRYGRVGIMAKDEYTTHIPEHSWLDPVFWNARARGLGATEQWPISTGAEENVLCYSQDSYRNEDIFLHEFSHGVHLLGAKYAISGFDTDLAYWYNNARSTGKWANTYAMSTKEEYFAEGTQSFFGVNAYSQRADGVHNHVNTRALLRSYDSNLYNMVSKVFPCGNEVIKRCTKSRSAELNQCLRMDCNEVSGGRAEPHCDGERRDDEDREDEDRKDEDREDEEDRGRNCEDVGEHCEYWSDSGYCTSAEWREWMGENCARTCGTCREDEEDEERRNEDCEDLGDHCPYWSGEGMCESGEWKNWMSENCAKTCGTCPDREDEDEEREDEEREDEEREDEEREESCKDRKPNQCIKWAKQGKCKFATKKRQCRKSCKVCKATPF